MQPSALHLRPATIKDANDIVRVHFLAVHGTASQAYPANVLRHWAAAADDEPPRAATREAIARGEEVLVVAEIDGVVAGFGSVVPALEELRAVYVDPGFGRRGVGSAILGHLEALAAGRGLRRLQTDASINAERFYARHGYAVLRRGSHRLAGGIEMASVTMSKVIVDSNACRPGC